MKVWHVDSVGIDKRCHPVEGSKRHPRVALEPSPSDVSMRLITSVKAEAFDGKHPVSYKAPLKALEFPHGTPHFSPSKA